MGQVGVEGEEHVFGADDLGPELELDSLVGHLSDIVPEAGESAGARKGHVIDKILCELAVVAELCVESVLPQPEFETGVKLVGNLPFEGGVAHGHKGDSVSGLVPFLRVHAVCCEGCVGREVDFSGPSVGGPQAQHRDRGRFHEVVFVDVQTGSGSPERGELVVLSE